MASKFKEEACFCAWTNTILSPTGTTLKEIVIPFIDGMLGILQIVKSTYTLLQFEAIEDRGKAAALELVLDSTKIVTDPIKGYLSNIAGYFAQWADCPPVACMATITSTVNNWVLSEVDQMENDIADALRYLDEVDEKVIFIDRWIAFFQEARDTVENVCGTT